MFYRFWKYLTDLCNYWNCFKFGSYISSISEKSLSYNRNFRPLLGLEVGAVLTLFGDLVTLVTYKMIIYLKYHEISSSKFFSVLFDEDKDEVSCKIDYFIALGTKVNTYVECSSVSYFIEVCDKSPYEYLHLLCAPWPIWMPFYLIYLCRVY